MTSPFLLDHSQLDSIFTPLSINTGRDILAEVDAFDLGAQTNLTLYFGSRGYNHPSAPGYFVPRLLQPLNFRRDMYSAATTGGASRNSYGEMRLINHDGGLDFMRGYGIVGRQVRMFIGHINYTYNSFESLIVGKANRILFNNDEVTIQLRDQLEDLNVPLQSHKFLGTNVLPDGVEGVEDIKDKAKPLLYGSVLNVSPICVNTSLLIYQVNDGPINGVLVYDNGVPLTLAPSYASVADMMANEPAPGEYRQYQPGGYFRLGATPIGTITCDVADGSQASDNTAGEVILRILERTPDTGMGGVPDSNISLSDISRLNTSNSSIVGISVDANATYSSALDSIVASVGAWYGFDRFGIFRLQRLELPVGPAAISFRQSSLLNPMAVREYNIVNYRFVPSNDPEKGTPAYRVSLTYARNYTQQAANAVSGSVDQSRKNFLALAERSVTYESTAVQVDYPLAVEKKVTTLLLDQAGAAEEASRLITIFGVPRDFLEIDVVMTFDVIALVDLGTVINVTIDRMGFSGAGRLMRVIGMQYNAQIGLVTITCWG